MNVITKDGHYVNSLIKINLCMIYIWESRVTEAMRLSLWFYIHWWIKYSFENHSCSFFDRKEKVATLRFCCQTETNFNVNNPKNGMLINIFNFIDNTELICSSEWISIDTADVF